MLTKKMALLSTVVGVYVLGCGDDDPGTGTNVDASADSHVTGDAQADGSVPDGNINCTPTAAPTPEAPTGAGVAYAGHWWSNELFAVRFDGDAPRIDLNVDLGLPVRQLRIDPSTDRLYLISEPRPEGGYEARIYQLDVPESPAAALGMPQLLGSIEFGAGIPDAEFKKPLSVAIDGYTQRLYIIVAQIDPTTSNPVQNQLRVYDVSDPASPREIMEARTLTPAGIYSAVDPYRHLLFTLNTGGRIDRNVYFRTYDISAPVPVELTGSPVTMQDAFPDDPDDQTGYQIRNPRVDYSRNRIYMAQAESSNSQLVGFEYPSFVPNNCERYSDMHGMAEFTPLEDGFEVEKEPGDAQNLLGAHQPIVEWNTGGVIMSAAAWGGTPQTARSAMAVGFNASLQLMPSCEGYEGFGCFYRRTAGGQELDASLTVTDGAACLDPTYRVYVGTDVSNPEANPGQFHLFKYDSEFSMVPFRAAGDNLPTAGLVVGLDCHLRIQ